MSDKEVLRGILEVLKDMNERLGKLENAILDEKGESRLFGIQVAIGEFHHDVEAKNTQQDQAIERLRERHGVLAERIGDLQKAQPAE